MQAVASRCMYRQSSGEDSHLPDLGTNEDLGVDVGVGSRRASLAPKPLSFAGFVRVQVVRRCVQANDAMWCANLVGAGLDLMGAELRGYLEDPS
jgi:hypothetical protein